jgi:hypothetical protein
MKARITLLIAGAWLAGCAEDPAADAAGATEGLGADRVPARWAESVVAFEAGANAGFGREHFPAIVLGPPASMGFEAGSLDVLSLGVEGEIVLAFGDSAVVDGPGPDLVIFENAFYYGPADAEPRAVWAEPAEVSVSDDGETWHTWPCEPGTGAGCAGVEPAGAFDPALPFDPAVAGGDAFDLAALGVERARFVRIRDVAESGAPPTAGFDLDAVGLVHFE